MKNLRWSLILGLALPATAQAEPADSWTGFHVGINTGYDFGSQFNNGGRSVDLTTTGGQTTILLQAGYLSGNQSLNTTGFIEGGQIGYDHSLARHFLGGLEADFQGANISGHAEYVSPVNPILGEPFTTDYNETLRWFSTVRARIGVLPTEIGLAYAGERSALADYMRRQYLRFIIVLKI